MPAINAAASPVSAASAPSTPNASSSAAGASSGERPFSAVLAEQTGKSAKGADRERSTGSSTATTATNDNGTPTVPATEVPVATDAQGPVPPLVAGDALQAEEPSDDGIPETPMQSAAELIQAVLISGGTGMDPAQPATAATAAIPATTATSASPMPAGSETGIGADPQGETIADVRLAIARSARGETAPDRTDAPAKLAAPGTVFTLPVETQAMQPADFTTARSDAGTAQAAATMVAALTTQPATVAPPRSGAEYRIATPVGSQHWETAIGNSLVIMSGAQQDRAELVLTPPQLGRIEVSISMKGDEATAMFVSASPAVREALESALPRLREVLAEAGIALGQTQVGAESQGQSAGDRQNGDNASSRGIADASGSGESQLGAGNPAGSMHRVISRLLVDTYA